MTLLREASLIPAGAWYRNLRLQVDRLDRVSQGVRIVSAQPGDELTFNPVGVYVSTNLLNAAKLVTPRRWGRCL